MSAAKRGNSGSANTLKRTKFCGISSDDRTAGRFQFVRTTAGTAKAGISLQRATSQGRSDEMAGESDLDEELERAHYRNIIEMNRAVTQAMIDHQEKKKAASDAKKLLDGLSEDLSALISSGPDEPDLQMELPFDGEGDSDDE